MKETEKAILAVAIEYPEVQFFFFENCDVDFFASVHAKKVFQVIERLYLENRKVDWMTLIDLSEEIPNEYMHSLPETLKAIHNAQSFIHEKIAFIKNLRAKRELLKEVHKEGQSLNPDFERIQEIISNARIIELKTEDNDFMSAYQEYLKWKEKDTINIQLGLPTFDRWIGGFQYGEIISVLARTSIGKTFYAIKCLQEIPQELYSATGFFSFEMPKPALVERMLQMYFNLWREDLAYQIDELNVNEFQNKYRKLRLYTYPYTIEEISKITERDDLKIIFIDFLQLIKDEDNGGNSYERTSRKMQQLKHLAMSRGILIYLLVQLSRKAGSGWEVVTFDAARECFDEKTEILSENGWINISKLQKGLKVLTLNTVDNTASYVLPKKYVKYDYNGKLYCYKNCNTDFAVTPEHKFFYRKENSKQKRMNAIKDIGGKKIHIQRTFNWKGTNRRFFYLPGIIKEKSVYGKYNRIILEKKIPMNIWLDFLGWYLSEGYCDCGKKHIGYRIMISQKSLIKENMIRNVLNKLGFHFGKYTTKKGETKFVAHNKQLYSYLSELGKKAKTKTIPRYICELSSRQIRIFLDSFLCGDGCVHKGTKYYYTTSKQMADTIQELILKTGGYGSIFYKKATGKKTYIEDHYATNKSDLYLISEWRKPTEATIENKKIRHIDYKGKVYCVGVGGSQLIYVRRNGKCLWSGNSGQIEELSDFIVGIWNPSLNPNLSEIKKTMSEGTIKIALLKNKRGPTISIDAHFDKKSGKIYEMEKM